MEQLSDLDDDDYSTGKMAVDRGSGAYLKKRLGGGREVHCYGGSFKLADASIRNSRLDKRQSIQTQDIDEEQTRQMRMNIKEKLRLKETLQKLEEDRRKVEYFGADDLSLIRGSHPASLRQRAASLSFPLEAPQPRGDLPPIRVQGSPSPIQKQKHLVTFKDVARNGSDEHSGPEEDIRGKLGSQSPMLGSSPGQQGLGSSPRQYAQGSSPRVQGQGSSPRQPRLKLVASMKGPPDSDVGFEHLVQDHKARSKKYEILMGQDGVTNHNASH